MKTVYYTAATLDGFLADADHALDWLFQFEPPAGEDHHERFAERVGALAMGSQTYAWLLRHQVFPAGREPGPWPYAQPTWVFTSRTLRAVPGADVRFARGDVRPVHAAMTAAAGGRDLWVVGGGDLAGQFHDAGLLDELHVTLASVTLGAGMPLLPRRIVTPPLRLLSARQHGEGFVSLRYAVPKPVA